MILKSIKNALIMASALSVISLSGFSNADEPLFDPIIEHSSKERAKIMLPVGSPFSQALHLEYLRLAEKRTSSPEIQNTFDTSFLSQKAVRAAQGYRVAPETPGNWSINLLYLPNLVEAHARLGTALNSGAMNTTPILAAKAQANYDCWVEDVARAGDTGPLSECSGAFNKAMDALEKSGLRALKPASGSASASGELEYKPEADDGDTFIPRYMIFFGYGKSGLDTQGRDVIEIAASKIMRMNPDQIELFGFTDSSGSKAANERLAMKRIDSVKQALIAKGVPAGKIRTRALGEDNPLVNTGDNRREAGNRRVEILLKKF